MPQGHGQAGADIAPGSVFLAQLNQHGRNPNVQYHLFLGSGAMLPHAVLLQLKEKLLVQAKRVDKYVVTDNLPASLDDVQELEAGKGDMAVAVERGRLEGVADTRVFPFNHGELVLTNTDPAAHPVFAAILEVLRQ